MFGVCFGAIAGAALLGWPRRSLTVVGLGVAGIAWLVLLGVLGHPGVGSAVAHAIAGALLGWALADGILRAPGVRAEARRVLVAGVLATLVVGAVWELWEWGTDALTGTDLTGGISDTILDLIAEGTGAAAGAALAVSFFGVPLPATRR
jgi:phage-related tail protein